MPTPYVRIPVFRRLPRLTTWLLLAVLLTVLLAILSPVQLPVALYKLCLVALASVVGYWIDRALFPYARPDAFLNRDWRLGTVEPVGEADYPVVTGYEAIFAACLIRRALVVGAVVIAVALGL